MIAGWEKLSAGARFPLMTFLPVREAGIEETGS